MKKYEVTRQFTDGTLNGLTHTGITTVKYIEGSIHKKNKFSDQFKIISCKEIKHL